MNKFLAIIISAVLLTVTLLPFPHVSAESGGRLFGARVGAKIRIGKKDALMLGTTASNGTLDWQTVLAASTVSSKAPVLIIENKTPTDEMSAQLFLDQYKPKKVYLHNYSLGAEWNNVQLNKSINADLYKRSNFVVVADGSDYSKGLSAASFAAYYGIPLFFTPFDEDEKNLISQWGAHTIGIEVSEQTDHPLTISESLELVKKKSDYLIVTTSDDLTATVRPRFSLAAPILAGGRKALVLNIENPTRESVKKRIDEETRNGFRPAYLVAVGSEKNFPFIQFDTVPLNTYFNQDDTKQYFVNLYYWANFDQTNEYYADAATGAITGYSLNDISALIARSIFYKKIARSSEIVQWSPYNGREEEREGGSLIESVIDPVLSKKYISNFKNFDLLSTQNAVIKEIEDSSAFIYNGHSSRMALGNMALDEIPYFQNPTFIFALGCAALEPWNLEKVEDSIDQPVIGYEAVRKGAVGIFGHAEISISVGQLFFGSNDRTMIEASLLRPIGESMFLVQNFRDALLLYHGENARLDGPNGPKSYTYLLGDPKLKFKAKSTFTPLVTSAQRLRLNTKERQIFEEFGTNGGSPTLCRQFEEDCEDLMNAGGRKIQLPVVLDSYIESIDAGNSLSEGRLLPLRMFIRFFTTRPVDTIDVVPSSVYSPSLGVQKYTGNYCFNLGKKQFCPNFITTEYGRALFVGPERSITFDVPDFIDFVMQR